MKDFQFNLRYLGGIKHIKINFMSQYILDQLSILQAGIVDVQSKFNLLSDLQDYLDSPKVNRKIKKELKKEKKIIQKSISEYGENGYLEKRWETIKQLLIDNGYKEESDLMDYDFWYKQVDRKEVKRFIEYCVAYSIEAA